MGNAVNVTDLNYTSVSLNQAQSKIDKGEQARGASRWLSLFAALRALSPPCGRECVYVQ